MRGRRKKTKEKFALVEGESKESLEFDAASIEKEYLEVFNYQRKTRNNLLGEFAGGKYEIKDETILKKLYEIPKKFIGTEDNVDYFSQKLDEFVLNFKAEFDISESYCTARLYLIETETIFVDNQKYITLLDEQVAPYSPTFKQEMFRAWNVYFDESPKLPDDYLLTYMKMRENEVEFSREITDVLGQLFILKILKFFDEKGDEGAKLKLEFNLLLEKFRPAFADIDSNFMLQKIIMDRVLFNFGGMTLLLKSKEGTAILQEYSRPLKNIKDKTIIEETKKDKPAEKEEKPKVEAKKPAVKKSASKAPDIKPYILDLSKSLSPGKSDSKKKKGGGSPIKTPATKTAAPKTPQINLNPFVPDRPKTAEPVAAEKPKATVEPTPKKTTTITTDETPKASLGDLQKNINGKLNTLKTLTTGRGLVSIHDLDDPTKSSDNSNKSKTNNMDVIKGF